MKSLQADALGIALLFDGGHELAGRQNAIMTDEAADLRPERNEGDEINHAQRAQKNPARQKIIRLFNVPAPEPAGEQREKCPVAGDKSIGEFRDSGDDRGIFINAQRPSPFWIFRQCAKNRFRAGINRAVRFNQLDCSLKSITWNFRELCCDTGILRWQIIHGITGHLLPAADPQRAEIAVAVENHQRFWRRRGDPDVAFHGSTLNQ